MNVNGGGTALALAGTRARGAPLALHAQPPNRASVAVVEPPSDHPLNVGLLRVFATLIQIDLSSLIFVPFVQ